MISRDHARKCASTCELFLKQVTYLSLIKINPILSLKCEALSGCHFALNSEVE